MKIKYNIATGSIITMGQIPGVTAGVGEAVDDYTGEIPPGPINNFKFVGGELVAKTQPELDAMPANIAIADRAAENTDFSTSIFRNITPAQADTWIQNNVTDLASTKLVLRKIVRVLVYLIKRSNLT